MSDADYGKKLVEEAQLQLFLDEYEAITACGLSPVWRSERPDFVCKRRGRVVGVELVQVMQDPALRLNRDDMMDGYDASIRVQQAVYVKEAKRTSIGWQYADHTILVVQLLDATVVDVAKHLDKELMEEMASTGFLEIWAVDYTIKEAYRTVQLLGVKPRRWRGLHAHRFVDKKPFG